MKTLITVVVWALLLVPALPSLARAAEKPNILILLTDDQGRGDYGAFGTPDIRTPNIDRLFREGMTFDNFYANSCVCSPSRAALLTGRYPDRVGVPGVIREEEPNDSWGYLAPGAVLLPKLLKPAGYHCALVGKWHLGLTSPNLPNERGFDEFDGFLGDMMDDYWSHLRHGHNFMRHNADVVQPQGHATDVFTDWACQYLRDRAAGAGRDPKGANGAKDPEATTPAAGRADARQPFFLYLAYNAPHDPVQPPAEWLAKVRRREPGISDKRAKLVALIEHLDSGIGRVLDVLDETGLARDTLVLYSSDNGGLLASGANNGPWRSGKGHVYEGGLRVPFAARWPGRVKAESRCERVALTMDLFATALDAAGVAPPAGTDGVSLLPTLRGAPPGEGQTGGPGASGATNPQPHFYFVRREGGPAYGGKTIEALRRGDWKLLQDSPYRPLELYNLKDDPQEKTDLSAREGQIFSSLSAELRRQVQAGGTTPWQPPQR